MFNSNTAPKVIKKKNPEPWFCHKCDQDISYWHSKCPACGGKRRG